MVVVAVMIAVPVFRDVALSSCRVGTTWVAPMDNVKVKWTDHYGGGDGFRGVMYPLYSNPDAVWPDYARVNVKTPDPPERKGVFWVRGRRLEFPDGTNLAIVSPDGGVRFVHVPPAAFEYDSMESMAQKAGFTARKRFRRAPKLDWFREAGLLPPWARVRRVLGDGAPEGAAETGRMR